MEEQQAIETSGYDTPTFLDPNLSEEERRNPMSLFTALDQGANCCADRHQTYFGAIIRSPEWKLWVKEQNRRFHEGVSSSILIIEDCYDVDESICCGTISSDHFSAFLRFVRTLPVDLKEEDEE